MFPFGEMLLSPLFYKMGTEAEREEERKTSCTQNAWNQEPENNVIKNRNK